MRIKTTQELINDAPKILVAVICVGIINGLLTALLHLL